MSHIRISRQAAVDEREIWLRIARRSQQSARRLFAELRHNYQTLADFPGLGEACEELGTELRSFPVGSYVIYYRPIEGGIEVARVVHGARDVNALFEPGM